MHNFKLECRSTAPQASCNLQDGLFASVYSKHNFKCWFGIVCTKGISIHHPRDFPFFQSNYAVTSNGSPNELYIIVISYFTISFSFKLFSSWFYPSISRTSQIMWLRLRQQLPLLQWELLPKLLLFLGVEVIALQLFYYHSVNSCTVSPYMVYPVNGRGSQFVLNINCSLAFL